MASTISHESNCGPKVWNSNELKIADALGTRRAIRETDLDNDVHTIFDKKRWLNITDAEYDLILPSARLATKLLEVGLPYLTNFLPSNQIHDKFAAGIPSDTEHFVQFMKHYHVAFKPIEEVTDDALEIARGELAQIAECVTWRFDNTMFKNKSWSGITRLVSDKYASPPYGDLTSRAIQEADRHSQDQGLARRPLLIGIMQEYMDALKRYNPQTEPHIRATFLAAYTMAHEIGHVVWAQDFRSVKYSDSGLEPWVADDPINELGSSFMSWIFGGYDANIRQKQGQMFESNLIWDYRPRTAPRTSTDLYSLQYSLSLRYMEDMLSKAVWAGISQPEKSRAWSEASRTRFKPDVSCSATATIATWVLDGSSPEWRCNTYCERSGVHGNPEPTKEEIDLISRQNPRQVNEEESFSSLASESSATHKHSSTNDRQMREIYGGVLRQDKQPIQHQVKSYLTRVWVTCRSEVDEEPCSLETTKKRPRWSSESIDVNSGKRQRTSSYDTEDEQEVSARNRDREIRFSEVQDYDCRNVRQVLDNISVEAVTCLTMYRAWQYCYSHDVDFPYHFQEEVSWQDQQLNRRQHLQLISRLRMFRFSKAEEFFAQRGDINSLVLVIKARIESLDDWADEDIQKILEHKGLSRGDDDAENRNTLQTFFEQQIQSMDLPEAPARFKPHTRDTPYHWTDEEQTNFLEIHDLSRWGDHGTRAARIDQYMRELDNLDNDSHTVVTRNTIGSVRRSSDGSNERYTWDVVLQRTRVSTLKAELLKQGHFPYNCELELYFGSDRRSHLEDDKWLWEYDLAIVKDRSSHGSAMWKDLWVTVKVPKQQPKPDPEPTRTVYLPRRLSVSRNSAPKANFEGKIISSSSNSASSVTTAAGLDGIGNGRATSHDVPFKVPKHLQRTKHIIDHPEDRNLAELMESIGNDAATMNQAMRPRGGLDSILKPNGMRAKVVGAAEMLDNLQDRMQAEDERRKLLEYEITDPDERPVLPARPLKNAEECDVETAADGLVKSHMRCLYDLIPQPEDPSSSSVVSSPDSP